MKLTQEEIDAHWMCECIAVARRGQEQGEWPFGAVVVSPPGLDYPYGLPLSPPSHSTERVTGNPAGHAELHAIERAGIKHGRLLRGCTLYSTHEPCVMCTGLILQAKPSRVVVSTLRVHLPHLFSPRPVRFADLLWDCRNPDYPIEVAGTSPLLEECMALFDGMVDDAVSVSR